MSAPRTSAVRAAFPSTTPRARALLSAAGLAAGAALLVHGCAEGSGAGNPSNFAASLQSLTAGEVDLLLARAVSEAQALGRPAAVAVVDREGEVLGAFVMNAADVNGDGDMDALSAGNLGTAISKAATAAAFQSEQDAFTSRTAYFIVQGNYPPGVANTAAGPLFGVQDSGLASSDVRSAAYDQNGNAVGRGISGEWGGIPLFKNGAPVGGIGIDTVDVLTTQGGQPTLVSPVQNDLDEAIASGAAAFMSAPVVIRATQIVVDGIVFPFVETVPRVGAPLLATDAAGLVTAGLGTIPAAFPVRASPLAPEDRVGGQFGIRASRRYQGRLVARFAGPFTSADRAGGVAFNPASYAVTAAPVAAMGTQTLGGILGEVRFPSIDSVEPPPAEGGLTQADVQEILARGAREADASSAAIRLPRGTGARVHVAVVDLRGNILGIFRMGDGTLFSQDIAVQKARTAAFFSSDDLAASARGIGFISQPFFPPGAGNAPVGPLARLRDLVNRGLVPIEARPSLTVVFPPPRPPSDGTTDEDPLTPGLQAFDDYAGAAPVSLATARARIAASGGTPPLVDRPDTAPPFVSPGLQGGMQTFAGGVPLYKNGRLVGAVGASGDGIDEDDATVFAASQAPFAPPPGARIDEAPEGRIVARINAKVAALAAAVAGHADPAVSQVYGPLFARERDAIAAALTANGLSGVRLPYVKLPRNPRDRS